MTSDAKHVENVYEEYSRLALSLARKLWGRWGQNMKVSQSMDLEDLEQSALMELMDIAPRVDLGRDGAATYVGLIIYRRLLEFIIHARDTHGEKLEDWYDPPDERVNDAGIRDAMSGMSAVEHILCEDLEAGRGQKQTCAKLGWTDVRYAAEIKRLKKMLSSE